MRLAADQLLRRFIAPVPFLLIAIVSALAALPVSDAEDTTPAHHSTPNRSESIHSLPLTFERSEGKFISRTPGYTVALEPRQVTVTLRSSAERHSSKTPFVRMRLLDSNAFSALSPEEPLSGKANYFIGNDPAKWRTNVALFGKVRVSSIYKNVDLVYYGKQQQLEYDFVIQPGGDPGAIRFSVDGASHTRIAPNGDLNLGVGGSRAILHQPVAYQIIDGRRHNIAAGFLPLPGGRFGLRVAQYERKSPLIIDPVLAYSTYLGGSDDEGVFGIGFDDDGNIYVAGETASRNFPEKGGVQGSLGGGYDAFVSKFNS
ncbi:MAG: SBBP repeat-containing protein, partial [Acidobacteriaceae bacterium]|nr:SBBP repeat-containing protein [Acidobacteriaceae bacterium]